MKINTFSNHTNVHFIILISIVKKKILDKKVHCYLILKVVTFIYNVYQHYNKVSILFSINLNYTFLQRLFNYYVYFNKKNFFIVIKRIILIVISIFNMNNLVFSFDKVIVHSKVIYFIY